jgi:curved DNA-binding protein CbpA
MTLSERALDENLDCIDYYSILGIARDAPANTIREAFHRFALRYHPDQHIDSPEEAIRALRVFKRGNEGYRVLLDPVLRSRYDVVLTRGEIRLTSQNERIPVVQEARGVSTLSSDELPIPSDIAPLYEKCSEAFKKGDIKNAKTFLLLMSRKSAHPKVQALTKEILEAERALLRRR